MDIKECRQKYNSLVSESEKINEKANKLLNEAGKILDSADEYKEELILEELKNSNVVWKISVDSGRVLLTGECSEYSGKLICDLETYDHFGGHHFSLRFDGYFNVLVNDYMIEILVEENRFKEFIQKTNINIVHNLDEQIEKLREDIKLLKNSKKFIDNIIED